MPDSHRIKIYIKFLNEIWNLLKLLKDVLSIHPDIIHHTALFGFPRMDLLAIFSKLFNIKMISHQSSSHLLKYNQFFEKYIRSKISINFISRFLCITKAQIKQLRMLYGVPNQKIIFLPNVVDDEDFFPINKRNARQHLKFSLNKNYLLYVGRLEKEKGLLILLNAFKRLLEKNRLEYTELIFIGEGLFKQELIDICNQLEISEKVIFLGWLPRKELKYYYNACDLLIYPSFIEGSPLALIEAMKCGLPIIASDIPGLDELVIQNKTGLLFKAGSSNDLQEKIYKLLQNHGIREKFEKESLRVANKLYSLENNLKILIELYEKLL
ncbi:MAG: glycosyltransferase family 4 protein [Candidatus Helarchaeota archaeon]